MPEGWGQVPLWFVTVVVGAGLVKLLDLAVERYRNRHNRWDGMLDKILAYLEELGRLIQLHRLYARHSASLRTNKSGEFERDETGDFVVENVAFMPEPDAAEGVKESYGKELREVINQKRIEAQVAYAAIHDLVLLIDPTGQLAQEFNTLLVHLLRMRSAWLDMKSDVEAEAVFHFAQILHDADEQRHNIIRRLERMRMK